MRALSYIWRLFGTACSFALFGLGGLFIGSAVIPVLALFVRDSERRIVGTRRIIGRSMRLFVGFMAAVGVLRYRIEGLEYVDRRQNYLILANHPSLIDVVFLLAFFPQAVCVVKQSIFENPFTRHVVRLAGYISNRDRADMLTESVARLAKGRSLILFPEGTRTSPDGTLKFSGAAAAIAVRAKSPCLPVLIRVQPTTLTKADRWYEIPPRQVEFRMWIERPFQPAEKLGPAPDSRRPDRSFHAFLTTYFSTRLAAVHQSAGDV